MDSKTKLESIVTKLGAFDIEASMNQSNPEIKVKNDQLIEISQILREDQSYELLLDVIAVDYLTFGNADWKTNTATNTGYSRAVQPTIIPEIDATFEDRFAVFYQLLSVSTNQRLTVKVFASESNPPTVPSVVSIWSSADWFEREAFDLFGILFENHNDLRRILTDYGFVGHPLRKDFPMIGEVEMRYDEELGRVVYEPVSIEPNVNVPRVIRK